MTDLAPRAYDRIELLDELLSRTLPDANGCWIWTGYIDKGGYGRSGQRTYRLGLSSLAHRAIYALAVGAVSDDLQLDHLCRVTACVNPSHLEPVTPAENTRRSESRSAINARKTHCKRGHPFDERNTYVRVIDGVTHRRCRACNCLYQRLRTARLRGAA